MLAEWVVEVGVVPPVGDKSSLHSVSTLAGIHTVYSVVATLQYYIDTC